MPELYDTVISFKQLSSDFLKILDQEETFDVIIHVGDEITSESFKAHSIILRTRSEYFRAALSAAWKKKENGFFVIDLRGMSIPHAIFGHVLFYIYGAYLKVEKLGVTEKLQLLKAADILMMDAFVDYLEADLIRTEKSWVNEKSSEVLYVALQISRCKELVSLCNDAILRQPKTFVSSKEFLFMPHDYVVSLIERDILGLDEIDIFAAVIMWGINNTPGISLADDFSTWTADNITTLQSNVIHLISQIRFFQMPPDDFMKKVGPLTRVFAPELYDQVVEYHANTQFQFIYDVQPLRLNSTIIKENEEPALISYWINHPETDCDLPENLPFETFNKIPFDFHLIFRCPGNELAQTAWRDLCYNQGPTMTIIRTKNQNEDEAVFGGYKSISWSTENRDTHIGGNGFIFGYLWQQRKLLLPWMLRVNNHLDADMFLGDGVEVFIDFRHGEKLLAHANGFEDLEETIEELEVFRVVRKATDEG
ncbi:5668_t:CDS:2 [Dentiscutata erythropus]|uniref:5668_t:CDS:1 n=1 Tax=Dentiscutata erythropus TaxID=1348616 RepID=A0A9N8VDW1_9GLOM|nr:5668_t:CDS:2 [Dentiscutata erythropus]